MNISEIDSFNTFTSTGQSSPTPFSETDENVKSAAKRTFGYDSSNSLDSSSCNTPIAIDGSNPSSPLIGTRRRLKAPRSPSQLASSPVAFMEEASNTTTIKIVKKIGLGSLSSSKAVFDLSSLSAALDDDESSEVSKRHNEDRSEILEF